MAQTIIPTSSSDLSHKSPETIESLKQRIKRLNSQAGQMKMDLHDIAEGLPTDLDRLPQVSVQTYEIYCQLRDLNKQLKRLEQAP